MEFSSNSTEKFGDINRNFDWLKVARLVLLSRSMDLIEEQRLYPEKKITYQFSARGHELIQALLGSLVCRPGDGLGCYYRSRPLMLSQGLTPAESFASSLALTGSMTEGRDIGVVGNLPTRGFATVLPMAGDVGSQYTPSVGWAESILYYHRTLGDERFASSVSVVQGGEGSVASNGFWSALTIATTIGLPLLIFIEDNGYAISVPSYKQTPGGNIAQNLQSFSNLWVFEADGTDPDGASNTIFEAVKFVRSHLGPALIRLSVPRLSGHSGQDSQAYKTSAKIESERARDPVTALRDYLVPAFMPAAQWDKLVSDCQAEAEAQLEMALTHLPPRPEDARKFVFLERDAAGEPIVQAGGGIAGISTELRPKVVEVVEEDQQPAVETSRINMTEGIRRTLAGEMRKNPLMVIFGEDVGKKGGVHTITQGLQDEFGAERVFDTSLSEEGIVGRAVGMALAGMLPVPEIQFRKYADAGMEQITNCGSLRWRTANKFAAPIIIRLPGGISRKGGDPWHSMSGESILAHLAGWNVVMPATTADAVGLLRTALRSQDPTLFFEHRALLDAPSARGQYPGEDYLIPFGSARTIATGTDATVVTWGAMIETVVQAVGLLASKQLSVEIIDLRTIYPWDRQAVLNSVRKTKRCLIAHEDTLTVGFGAEIAAVIAEEAFSDLDAPILRVASPDTPIPYNRGLMEALIPTAQIVAEKLDYLLSY